MRTPEKIKKGLECCAKDAPYPCSGCPYERTIEEEWSCELHSDALSYTQWLEAQVPKWISAKNPPKEEGEYIVIVRRADDREERMWDIFQPGRGWCEDNEGECVIAWMSFDALPDLQEEWKP